MKEKALSVLDIIILVVFISTAVWGIYLFRQDLMRTLEVRDAEPAGFVVIRDNIVQRRHGDRVLWDRLYADSIVYSGDLIRAADLSSALIFVGENEIFLSENTLIRIQRDASGTGSLRVELREGRVSITGSREDDSQEVFLEYMGNQIQAGRGTVLDAEVLEDIIAVQVSEGSASFISDGQKREIEQGRIIAMTHNGEEIDITSEDFKLSPLRFFRAETLTAISESISATASKLVNKVLQTSETIREFVLDSTDNAPPERESEAAVVSGLAAYYTVISGDTLSKIAGKTYGDARQWRRIFEANDIKNHDLIYPDQVFLIP